MSLSKVKAIGRPLKYENPEDLQAVMTEYFESILGEDGGWTEPPTISGLAFALGMTTRSLLRYEDKDDFCPIISRGKQICEIYLEQSALTSHSKNPISLLAMNFGRYEKREVDVNLSGDDEAINAARKRLGLIGRIDEPTG